MKRSFLNIKIRVKGIIILFTVLLVIPACQERLDEMNQNPNALTELPAEYLFTNAVRNTFRTRLHRTQADFGAQHAHLAISESWDRSTDSYDPGHLRGDVTQEIFGSLYSGPIKYCNDVITITAPDGNMPNEVQNALANIVAVLNFAKLTDVFGDVPYFEGGKGKEGIFIPKYDKQEDIYADMVERLKTNIDILKDADFADAFPGVDPIYNNNKDKWLRFANSFRLRLAMRARFVDPGKYNPIISECLKEELIETNGPVDDRDNSAYQNATLEHWDSESGELYNPWYDKYKDRNQSKIYSFNVSEKYVDWLRETGDPRLEVMVTKSTLSDEYIEWLRINNDPRLAFVEDPENAYFGMRNGLIIGERDGTDTYKVDGKSVTISLWPRKDISFLSDLVVARDQPLYFMTAAEVWFLRAEAALFDLGPGDANELYRMGIEQAMNQWGIDATDFLSNSSEGNLNGTDEEKFEQISTQMWVTLVPNYIEAWFNVRRTGYPVIPQRITDDLSKGATDGYMPKRLRYPQTTERIINGTNMQEAIDRMGGDNIDTPVWWDVRD